MGKGLKGFIRRVFTPRPSNAGHIAKILGKDRLPSETFYENEKTGEKYYSIHLGLGWPTTDASCPGYGVIVGVRKSNPIVFVALAECIGVTPEELVDNCLSLRRSWGYHTSPDLLRLWRAADPERFPDWALRSSELTKKNPTEGFTIAHFYDAQQPNSFEIWLQTLRSLTRPGVERALGGKCEIARRNLYSIPNKISKKPIADYPIIACIAGLMHSLVKEKPWYEYVERERLIGTMPDPIFDDAMEQEEVANELYGYEDEDDDYGDDGAGISTMPGG